MKTSRRKNKKDFKGAEEHLMEVLREIEKAALGDKNPTRVVDSINDQEPHKQTELPSSEKSGRKQEADSRDKTSETPGL
jgi:hypothetical protein